MVYVISDLHGLKLERLTALLDKAGFSRSDWLYIIGDVVDRQNDGGVEMLEWLLYQPNVQLLRGNHEDMLLSCRFVLDEVTDESIAALDEMKLKLLSHYMRNGAEVTLNSLKKLKKSSPETVEAIFDYLLDAPIYEYVSAGGRDFLLLHGGLRDFSPARPISDYAPHDIVWERPKIDDKYFENITTVIGHTPTDEYGEEYNGKIVYTKTWIDIDVGAAYGNPPILLRLDDMKEFTE